MRIHLGLLVPAAFLLGACSASIPGAPDTAQNRPLPEAVVAMAATGQDLESARLLPEDGCYWYLHNGPVEATLVPLRTPRGNPICTAPAA